MKQECNAIVYTSNTGNTEKYAKMLGDELELPVYSLNEAKAQLADGAEIIYLGWIMAGGIKGYKEAAKKYAVSTVCGVGMGSTGEQTDYVRKQNAIAKDMPLFTLQGGYDIKKLHGIHKFIMNTITKSAVKSLAQKPNRTEADNDMLEMLLKGGSRVNIDSLKPIIEMYKDK